MKYCLAPLLLFVISGCGNMENRKTSYSGTTECVDAGCTAVFDVEIKKADRIVNQRQIVPAFRKCLGLTPGQVSTTSTNAFDAVAASLSKEGETKEISSAMLMAVTKLASEMCTDLINVEKDSSNRNYFMGYTLSGGGDGMQSYNLDKMLSKFSNNCWGRAVTTTERQFFEDVIAGFGKSTPGALKLCTTILSSADTLRY